MIKLINISKRYQAADKEVLALENINMTINDHSFTVITGPSGCGKTTLLNILAGYDIPTSGQYFYNGELVNGLSGKQLNDFYRSEVGTVFQEFHLLPYLNVYENISLPAYYSYRQLSRTDIDAVLEKVDLAGLGNRYPEQLSGGQKQRVAIARLLIQKSRVLLADEPTGALDDDNGIIVVKLLRELQKEGMTVILVTHDMKMAQFADVIYRMENGHVVS